MTILPAVLVTLATYFACIAAGHWLASWAEHRADRLRAIQRDLWGTDKL